MSFEPASEDAPVVHALFDSLGLSVRYNIRSDELPTAMANVNTPAALDALRSAVHETMHMVQLCATPYGYFYACLKRTQAARIQQIIASLRLQHGLRVRLLIIDQIRSLRAKKYAHLHGWLDRWYLAELMLLIMEGDTDTFLEVRQQHPVLSEWTTEELIEAATDQVDQLLTRMGVASDVERRKLTPSFPQEKIEITERAFWRVSTIDILESCATVAEWRVYLDPATHPFWALEAATGPAQSVTLLSLVNDVYRPATVGLLGRTHLALSEIALASPLLPSHRGFWTSDTTSGALLPHARFVRALHACIPPPLDFATDWVRYTEEVCSRLGWPTPQEVARHTPQTLRGCGWIRCVLFAEGQRIREQLPTVFADPDVLLAMHVGHRRDAEVMRYLAEFFRPVLEQFSDGTRVRDKEVVGTVMEDFAVETYLRQAFLSEDLRVRFPWQLDEYTVSRCRSGIERVMMDAGGQRPRVEFIFDEPGTVLLP